MSRDRQAGLAELKERRRNSTAFGLAKNGSESHLFSNIIHSSAFGLAKNGLYNFISILHRLQFDASFGFLRSILLEL